MAEDIIIRADRLGKKYLIDHMGSLRRKVTTREALMNKAASAVRTAVDLIHGKGFTHKTQSEQFWALKDVSFQVRRGEILGIIGHNGAGKSTLLKILSRITEPTEGRVTIGGRIASLLEVGTGFHPELTGRENVFLNGAILGMTRSEVRRKFDEIVTFAGVERFLDTPVKRYSNGMHVRLAFAVAAHLEPEILIVDEVLAVGDAEFQEKCLGKMSDVVGSGRTVLFVSHNLDAIRRIAVNGLLLSNGRVEFMGGVEDCIEEYLTKSTKAQVGHVLQFPPQPVEKCHVTRIEVLSESDKPLPSPRTWDFVRFRIFYHSPLYYRNGSIILYLSTQSGTTLTICSTAPGSAYSMSIAPGENFVDCDIPSLTLSAGVFIIGAGIAIPNVEWLYNRPHAALLEVAGNDVFNSGNAPLARQYPIAIAHQWRIPTTEKNLAE